MRSDNDIIFMKRALELAHMAEGNTRPNPMVGAVIVHNGSIIGEGYHTRAGEPHAEVIAIRSAPEELLPESTLYVTLEPCSHFGKTPPCSELIAEKALKRVVVGTVDTSEKVSGKGISLMRERGCEVIVGLLEEECRKINRRFFTFHEKGRPYIVLKWAESEDGFIDRDRVAKPGSGPTWITGKEERLLVHKWRSEEQAILIGEKTLVNDNPDLTVRYWNGINPLRVVVSDSPTLPGGLKMLTDELPLLLFSTVPHHLGINKENIVFAKKDGLITEVLNELISRDIQSVIVEGGASIIQQFIDNDLWDEARVFRGNKKLGSGLPAPVIKCEYEVEKIFTDSTLICFHK